MTKVLVEEPSSADRHPTRPSADRVIDGLIVAFCALRVIAVVGLTAGHLPDSGEYEHLSLSGHAVRPWTLPLLYRSVTSDGARILMHAVNGAIAWSVLATTVAIGINDRRVRRGAVAVLLALGLCVSITNWDTMILSESLGISLFVLFIAAWLRWTRHPSILTGVFVVGIATLFTFLRQDHLYVTWVLVVVTAVVALRRHGTARIRWAGLAVALLAVSVWGHLTYRVDHTLADFNIAEAIADRMLPDADRAQWFIEHGMPVPQGFTPGTYLYDKPPGETALKDPDFEQWVHVHGLSVYLRFLATHPWYSFESPLGDFLGNTSSTLGPTQFGVSMLAPTDVYGQARAVEPALVEFTLLVPGNAGTVVVAFLVVVVAVVLQWRRNGYDVRWSVPAVTLLIAIPFLWLVWHASSLEPARHAIDIAIAGRVALIILGAALLDRWLTMRSADEPT